MAALPIKRYTPEEYFNTEEATEYKNEYFHGEISAMAGASRAHNRITLNLLTLLDPSTSNESCEVFGSDTRVKVSEIVYTYPDLSAACGDPKFTDKKLQSLTNPILIIEVLSPTTEAFDRGEKFANYRRISTLQQYVLISQDKMRTESFVRQPDDQWLLKVVDDASGTLELPSIGTRVPLKDIYARVTFDADNVATAA